MAVVLGNRAKMSTSTTGTGTITLGSALSGYQTFAQAGITNGQTVRYAIEDGTGFEIGSGVYTSSGTTLTRSVTESSNSDSAISLSGSAEVFITASAADIFVNDGATSLTTTGVGTFASLDISGDVDVDGTTNLDAVDIDGAVNIAADLTIASTNKILFNDASQFIQGSSATVLTIAATDEIDLTATTIDINGAVALNGAITGATNITLSGELDAATGDFSGDVDVDGTLEADAITLNGTAVTATATLDTGISNNNVPKFTSGVADNDFLRVDGTAIEGRSASEVLSDIAAAPAAGSSNIVTTGALNSGSITSGFGAIDNGSSNITTTGVGTFGSLDISGNIDIDGTTNLDAVDIDGAVQLDATFTVGANDQGYDVTLHGDTAARNVVWDSSADSLIFSDNAKAVFGAGPDLAIYHDGTNSIIDDTDSGFIAIRSDTMVKLLKRTGNENMVVAVPDGAVSLYYDNAVKLATTAAGVDVTGSLVCDSAINIEASSGYANIEMGGPDGAFVDFKAPFSDDYDGRVQWHNGDGLLKIATNSDNAIVLQHNNSTKLATTSTGVDVTGNVIASGTVEPAGDTAAGDNAAIGYTAAEGLILTGQGSTSDITLKNDADATVFTVPTGTDDILFPDNAKAMFGAGSDLQIYHSGSDNMIEGVANEYLFIKHDNLLVRDLGNKDQIRAAKDGAVTLYYNSGQKLATTSSGVTVTGTVAATSYTGDGSNLTGVGGSTTWGAVGTYTVASYGSSLVSSGSTVAGSSLKTNAYSSGHKRPITHEWNSNENTSLGVSGTWRNMTGAATSTQFGKQVNCFWVRIS